MVKGYKSKRKRGWLGISIIVINTITINATETSVRWSSDSSDSFYCTFIATKAFPAT